MRNYGVIMAVTAVLKMPLKLKLATLTAIADGISKDREGVVESVTSATSSVQQLTEKNRHIVPRVGRGIYITMGEKLVRKRCLISVF